MFRTFFKCLLVSDLTLMLVSCNEYIAMHQERSTTALRDMGAFQHGKQQTPQSNQNISISAIDKFAAQCFITANCTVGCRKL